MTLKQLTDVYTGKMIIGFYDADGSATAFKFPFIPKEVFDIEIFSIEIQKDTLMIVLDPIRRGHVYAEE